MRLWTRKRRDESARCSRILCFCRISWRQNRLRKFSKIVGDSSPSSTGVQRMWSWTNFAKLSHRSGWTRPNSEKMWLKFFQSLRKGRLCRRAEHEPFSKCTGCQTDKTLRCMRPNHGLMSTKIVIWKDTVTACGKGIWTFCVCQPTHHVCPLWLSPRQRSNSILLTWWR
jgi:hypothetical protein